MHSASVEPEDGSLSDNPPFTDTLNRQSTQNHNVHASNVGLLGNLREKQPPNQLPPSDKFPKGGDESKKISIATMVSSVFSVPLNRKLR
jgi:hypothetical protein